MKKIFVAVITAITIAFLLLGCSARNNAIVKEPDIMQIRSICNLATLECYYHNVAKTTIMPNNRFDKERRAWISYTGIAKIGIDMTKVNMEIDGTNVTVFLPNAELLGEPSVDTKDLNENSYIIEGDNWLFPTEFSVEYQTKAFNDAQSKMKETVQNNKALLLNAQERAKKLIENYIVKMGEISNIEYQIEWVYANSNEIVNDEKLETQVDN